MSCNRGPNTPRRTGCFGQFQKALSFPTLHSTHGTGPTLICVHVACTQQHKPFQGTWRCQRSKPGKLKGLQFCHFQLVPWVSKAACVQGWSGHLPNPLVQEAGTPLTVSDKLPQPWHYWHCEPDGSLLAALGLPVHRRMFSSFPGL